MGVAMPEFSLSRRTLIRATAVLGAGAAVGAASLRTLLASAATGTGVDQPNIHNCVQWGARPPAGALTIDQHRPNKIIIHHTAFPNTTDYSLAYAYQNSRDIQNLHMDTNGWIDSGQHFTNSQGGYLTEGRNGSLYALLHGQTMVQGAHCVGQNDQAIGIENDGTFLTVQPTDAQWSSLVIFCAFTCKQYQIPSSEIYGHMDFNTTQCPGLLHDRLPELRSSVAALIG
jgi:N-acetylmuramoyl-L-alanine amidase-like protein